MPVSAMGAGKATRSTLRGEVEVKWPGYPSQVDNAGHSTKVESIFMKL